ncbi:hypothetical protein [Arthrobacter sp. LjRoot78]|uniref:hypothetical protein n=1 Tax=Arthrobacter sp. LjRoot78 TaxID=3342338 RepID=UPI003F50812F
MPPGCTRRCLRGWHRYHRPPPAVLYTGQYNSGGIYAYDPNTGQLPYQAAALPAGQNRPLDVCWDALNGLVIAGAQNDTGGGGCFAAYNPVTSQITTKVNPIDSLQMVRAVATKDGVAYLGGDNIYADGSRSTVVAWDPIANQELWCLDPGQRAGVAALAIHGRYLYGMSRRAAGLFVIDLDTRQLVHTADLSSVCTDFGALTVSRGIVYGASLTQRSSASIRRHSPSRWWSPGSTAAGTTART